MRKTTPTTLCLLLIAGSAWAAKPVDETRAASADARIEIEIVSGSIVVTGWDRNEMRVSGTIGDDVDALEISGDSDSLVIELDVPDSWGRRRRDIDAKLEISVPTSARLRVETVSANITVDDLMGTADLGSVSGDIGLDGQPTLAEVETVSGDIRVEGSQTAVTAETVSGDVELRGVARAVEASSVSGDVVVTAAEIERARFESVSGDIEFAGGLTGRARLQAESHSGDVTLRLPESTAATWEVETFSGNISNEFGPGPDRTDEYGPGKRLDFTTGSGEARITVNSFSGNVSFVKR